MIPYSENQARAFVTDAGTLQRGQQLAQTAKWGNLGRNDSTTWGECAGSGSRSCLTGLGLSEPAFKCSCPSRAFPCKHGAGLLLLTVRQPALFAEAAPPTWLEERLTKRQQTQGEKADKVAIAVAKATEATPAGEAAAAPSDTFDLAPKAPASAGREVSAVRLARMAQGADNLEFWLLGLMRNWRWPLTSATASCGPTAWLPGCWAPSSRTRNRTGRCGWSTWKPW